jgi:hypothetical protein
MPGLEESAMSEEQAQNLAALELAAGEPDLAVKQMADQAAAQEQAVVDQAANQNGAQVRMILAVSVPLLGAMYPSIGVIYTDQTCDQVAMVLGPVLTKYGIDLGDMSTKWGPEIAAAMVCGPIALATYRGIQADIADSLRQVPKADAGPPPQVTASEPETVTLG